MGVSSALLGGFAQALVAAIAVLHRRGSFLRDSLQPATFSNIAANVWLLTAYPFLNVGEDLWE